MTFDVNRLKEVRQLIDSVWRIIDTPVYPTDTNRKSYMFSELDSLVLISSLATKENYKESFVLLRTVLEKYLFFWLMFKGTKYKWTMHYNIEPRTSKTPLEARDKTLELWKNLKKSGDARYSKWDIRPGGKENVIIVTSEEEGPYITRNGKQTQEIVPIYNAMLEEYQPDIKHLSGIDNIVHSLTNLPDGEKIILKQDILYSHYFYIKNIYKNLYLNNLVSKFQLDIIKIHYNFLSKYVHPSRFSLQLWDDMHDSYRFDYVAKKETYKDLILFYCIRFMQLYLSVFISGYENAKDKGTYIKFHAIVDNLRENSKDFWFFDNDPTPFDVSYSQRLKESYLRRGKNVPVGLIYNENPFERLSMLRNYKVD